ncbi:hypothetical protein [Vibrio parahaemolyticus]|uniref:hypothetical protein n=1 Tax=Vibrio parahaemolyticus TaxID=670 RepID=UPI003AAEBB1A
MAPINRDESIHSFILRRMILFGVLNKPRDLGGVVSPGGVVYELPILNEKQRACLKDFDISRLAEIIDSNAPYLGADLKTRTQLANLVLQNEDADKSYREPASRTQLRYCIECVKLQLRSIGYSYFKIDWLRSADCSIHQTRLHHVSQLWHKCCGKRSNIYDNLKATLTGYCNKCQSDNWNFSTEVFIDDWNRAQYLFLKNYQPAFSEEKNRRLLEKTAGFIRQHRLKLAQSRKSSW